VVGNERLTALAGAVLLVLAVVEVVTVPTRTGIDQRKTLHGHVCERLQEVIAKIVDLITA
jgi:hypothetical protein